MARPSPEPGAASSARTPRCSTALPHRRLEARSVVVDGDDDARPCAVDGVDRDARRAPTCRRCRAGCRASRRGPRAGRGRRASGGDVDVDRRGRARRAAGAACAPAPSAESRDRAARAGRRAGGRGARVRQVVVDLPPHPLDLLADRRGQLACPAASARSASCAEHRQRRLQAVREIAGLGERARTAASRCVEQRVQIVDERLHLGRDSRRRRAGRGPRARRRAARAGGRTAPSAAAHLRTARHHAQHGDGRHQRRRCVKR